MSRRSLRAMRCTREERESASPSEAETYVHHLKNGVAFGAAMPETENNMHGPDEFAVIDELLMSAKIFAQVITELCC